MHEKDEGVVSRCPIFLYLLIVTPLGLLTKFYQGPAEAWINNYAGGILYELFWCLAVALVWPRVLGWRIALWIFIVTSALEFTQLWQTPFLESIRSTFIGRAFIGTSFSWLDFPHYALGCTMGWACIQRLQKRKGPS
jgi:hypothetical protein